MLILEELSRLAKFPPGIKDLTSEIRSKYRHWLLHYPTQCVLTAECILWEKTMSRTIERIMDKVAGDELNTVRYYCLYYIIKYKLNFGVI